MTEKQSESLQFMLKIFENAERSAGIYEEPEILTIKDFDQVSNKVEVSI